VFTVFGGAAWAETCNVPYAPDGNALGLWHMDAPNGKDDAIPNTPDDWSLLNFNPVSPSANASFGTANQVHTGVQRFDGAADYEGTMVVGGGTDVTMEGLFYFPSGVLDGSGVRWDPITAANAVFRLGYRGDARLECLVGGLSQFSDPLVLPDDEWVHLAMTYDAAGGLGAVKLYMNGEDITGTPATVAANLGGAGRIYVTSNHGEYVDEVRISDTIRVYEPFDPAIIPEPTTMALLGLAGLGLVVRRKR